MEENPYTDSVAAVPFAGKREEIEKANQYGIEPPRCKTCGELIVDMHPGVTRKYCNWICKLARTKKGQKKLLQKMGKNNAV